MRITTHGDYLVQLTRWPLLFPVNVYLVREDDGLTLIDTGMKGAAKQVLAQAEEMGLPITRIILTHTDPDHIGGLDQLRALLPEAEVLMSAKSAEILSGRLVVDKHGNEHRPGSPKELADTTPTGLLSDGDRVGSLEVIAAPGHKSDQVAFLDTRDRSLIAGDAFQTRAGLAVAGVVRLLFPFPGLATLDKPAALNTARRLRALEPSRLAIGHGPVLESPLAAMDEAIAEATRKFGIQAGHAR
jgi:glyoxylase-like metal-dependent hydrolase (beta-lactamase superfamily II)